MLDALLRDLAEVVARDSDRQLHSAACQHRSESISARLPLVRRLRPPHDANGKSTPWIVAVANRELVPAPPCTKLEERAGISGSIYFFLGASAFPKGDVAMVFNARLVRSVLCSFWPFDTGALSEYLSRRDGEQLDPEQTFQAFWGAGAAMGPFAAAFLAAHFRDPVDYARRGQKSEPDFAVYHGLVSDDDDRRAWTIEVQAHEPVSLAKESGYLEVIILQRPQLLAELPDDLAEFGKIKSKVDIGVREEIEQFLVREVA
jgi:hypothetical protein